jgi:hypothetical protein
MKKKVFIPFLPKSGGAITPLPPCPSVSDGHGDWKREAKFRGGH